MPPILTKQPHGGTLGFPTPAADLMISWNWFRLTVQGWAAPAGDVGSHHGLGVWSLGLAREETAQPAPKMRPHPVPDSKNNVHPVFYAI